MERENGITIGWTIFVGTCCLVAALVIGIVCVAIRLYSTSGPMKVSQVDRRIAAELEDTVAVQLKTNTSIAERHGNLISVKTFLVERKRGGGSLKGNSFPPRLEIQYLCTFDRFKAVLYAKVFKGAAFRLRMVPTQEFIRKHSGPETEWKQIDDQLWWVQPESRTQSFMHCDLSHPDFIEK